MLSKTEMNQITKLFSKMEGGDFSTVVRLFKREQSYRQTAAAAQFSVGQRVSFNSGRRGFVSGKIQKVNRKTVKVESSNGTLWRVPASLLECV